MQLLEAYLNGHRDPKKQRQPFRMPHPWDQPDAGHDTVSAEELAALKASLAARSAFRSIEP